jgi:hypothetical protein
LARVRLEEHDWTVELADRRSIWTTKILGEDFLVDVKSAQSPGDLKAEVLARDLDHVLQLSGLQELMLGDYVTADAYHRLARIRSLRSLRLANTFGESPITDDVCRSLGQMRSLKLLFAPDSPLTSAGFRHLCELTQLETLHIEGTQIDDDGLQPIGKLQNLRVLRLSDTRITDRGLRHLATLKKLQKLRLDNTEVRGPGLAHLAALPELVELDLSSTPVSGPGLEALAPGRSLFLNLGGTELTDEGTRNLYPLISANSIFLGRTAVTEAGAAALQQALPNCAVELRRW